MWQRGCSAFFLTINNIVNQFIVMKMCKKNKKNFGVFEKSSIFAASNYEKESCLTR